MAVYACQKAQELGAKVVTMSDSQGYIYDPNGIQLDIIKDIKSGSFELRSIVYTSIAIIKGQQKHPSFQRLAVCNSIRRSLFASIYYSTICSNSIIMLSSTSSTCTISSTRLRTNVKIFTKSLINYRKLRI